MTLEAFALATIARPGGDVESAGAVMRKVQIAALISEVLQSVIRPDVHRLMPGVGLCRQGSLLHPTVLGDRSQIDADSDGLIPISQAPVLRITLLSVLGGSLSEDMLRTLRVLPVSQGFLHNAPGSELLCTTGGRMGPHVRWGWGSEGFLTAGHVAQSSGAHVTDNRGTLLGTVLWSNDPATKGSKTGDVDVALVAFANPHTAITGHSSVILGAGDVLEVTSSRNHAAVFCFFDHLRLGAAQACYAQCYGTELIITQPGDSGGLCEAQGDVVGSVIGGFVKRNMTIVQSIGYQLREIRRHSGFMVSI